MTSTEALEKTPQPDAADAHETQGNTHAGHDHPSHEAEGETHVAEGHAEAADGHQGHSHEPGLHNTGHSHGPSLNPECTREIEVEVPEAEVSKAFRTTLKRYQKQARIPGFRAGKVPESLIRTRFAQEIRQDVLESLVPERFREAIAAQDLKPVSQPQVVDLQLFDGQPLRFKAAFEVVPAFEVSGYDSVRLARPETELTDAEFDAELARIRDSRSTMETVEEDRALVDGDIADIEFKGSVQGVEAPEPITGENVQIEVGGENTLAAFNDALRGSKAGQELQFEVDYPADFGEPKLAGKKVSYDVTVKGIKKKNMPEMNDEFAKELGDYESFEEFSAKLREHAAGVKKQQMENEAKDRIVEQMIARFQFPVPESLIQQQIDARLDRGLRALAQQGMKAEDMRKLDFERLRGAQYDTALNEVKASLILDKIADAENVQVSDEDIERELMIISMQTREPLESLRERLTEEGGINRIREQLRREKTGNLLYEKLAS